MALLLVLYQTFFYVHDGLRLEAYLYEPAGAGPFPLVVYNHGSRGGREEMPMEYVAAVLVPAGYAVLVPERRGYGKSQGKPFEEDVGTDRGRGFVARLQAETDDVLAAIDHVSQNPKLDMRRVAVMGYSFGGMVTTLAASRSGRFKVAVVQAPGAFTWPHSPELRALLPPAAAKIRIPIACMAAQNDWQTESTRTVCKRATGPTQLKIYPAFMPTPPLGEGANGHALFGPQGIGLWKRDLLAFLDQYLR